MEAWKKEEGTVPLAGEEIDTEEAVDRITAEPVFARISSPHYHSAAMDGIAVTAEDTFGATETNPMVLTEGEHYEHVDTGAPLPANRDAVIMVEELHPVADNAVEIVQAAAPWQYVRTMGEDVVASELLVSANHKLTPVDVGALLGTGVDRVNVRRKPRVVILPTGDELVEPGTEPAPGDIIEYNSRVLTGLCRQWGGEPVRFEPVPDNPEALASVVSEALNETDVVVINAGSSTGREDYAAEVISELGELLVHGVSIRPGNPVLLGIVNQKPVLGIPGYPVSTALTFELFAKPVIYRLQGLPLVDRPTVRARIVKKVASPAGREEFLRVQVGEVGSQNVAVPLARGSGVISSLVEADGLVRIPMNDQGLQVDEEVEVELLRPAESLERSLIVYGSHDMTLDLIADALARREPPSRMLSSHVGSLAGLRAVAEDKVHVAGSHLLEAATGEYNLPYIERMMPGADVAVVTLAHREQGLMVRSGNPRNVKGFESLTRDDVTYINRQRGAGTRILLDYHLEEACISPDDIEGYQRQAFTHMEVAAAVASQGATTGLGIRAAASALDLDFVPVTEERYDLVLRRKHLEHPVMQELLEVLESREFQRKVEELGGYDLRSTGKVRWL
jgi:putative molybdopterin biosynthesis protein